MTATPALRPEAGDPDTTAGAEPEPDDTAPAAAQQPPERSAAELRGSEALPRALKAFGTVVAPTTLLTALLFYFGLLHVTGLCRYLRVNYTVLGFTFEDYLLRSQDGLFVPLTGAAVVVLVAMWSHRLLLARVRDVENPRVLRVVAPLVALVGVVLGSVALVAAADPALFVTVPELPGLSLVVGVLMLAYAVRLARLWASRRRPDRPKAAASVVVAEWGVLFLVVSIGLFWAVGNYALKVGVTRGQQVVQQLPTTPDLMLFSEKSLSLDGPGVTELVCGPEDASYRYRYQGLKLVLQSGDQLLLLPAGWTRSDGTAIVLPRTDALRLEFSAPGTARDDSC
jgi:hypothetical protein